MATFPPYTDPCTVVADELAALPSWSQARDRLERWLFSNGCPEATPPNAFNWGKTIVPPLNAALPGNPGDRQLPQPGN
ncbi:hypothetical protein QTI17_17290 [Variovorax sp. J31P179]|uniref:hypothetical protein n=1 Tax=Variovorax sp. J31P179 TaxID=3053508 RepID=UPI002575DB8D|nr:hypothetical protein [Variovorax sp. J31P179]MDM0082350.1 hypothetical protein [Variovorax sp. J31P179]